MADRLISEEQAIEALLKAFAFHGYAGGMAANVIRQMPTIEAEPIKQGKWIADTYWHGYHCSLCGNQRSYIEVQVINYCPNCGADMREVTK